MSATKPFLVSRGLPPAGSALSGAVVAIGNFDGVHRGHRAVIDAARALGATLKAPAVVLTFDPHPRVFFRPDVPMFRLTDGNTELQVLAATGLDGAIVLTFDKAFASLTAEEFVRDILVKHLAIHGAVVGYDFHFGKGRGGSPDFLIAQGKEHGFAVEVVAQQRAGGQTFSSTEIRTALSDGRIADANAMLGYTWFVSGVVQHGEKRGRDLGFPTANLKLDPACGLRHGIYAVRVTIDGKTHDGVASFGRRPTFDNGAPLLETYIFDFSGDLYGKTIDVAFAGWIRPELKFNGLDPLIVQMKDDVAKARAILVKDDAKSRPAARSIQQI
ncbi:riboflavin biosynthesis protein RibF [Variibacter gotjawalensis]|uniref:Riboflavin biosynthesis protein n=1 Tax=Variibacter gotjawalensis TaxID=1333996 RepID=A0A0S3PSJ7_9BRAD|nr:bifunctional riboflavin kinase/FAD synthetase [Variibacter gotjawalensis]NIK49247.1 riboflavin kinase/FMN adenylyltransferase [Variibacter gotjawalensis]RZS51099.1 FMN adenylyltransferase /riboflavin kinase [Variibacter gotjawalensis]BAT58934.1 riboflavin biosynthesis protein RibF [Variibacter gotjawalensis]